MAEDTDTQVTDGAATATDETTQQPELGDAGQRALREERRKAREAAKERDALQARLKEYEDRDKTEQQRLTESQAAAEQRAQAAELRATRLEVAHEKGLTPAQAKRLVGMTREELEADAEEVLKDFPAGATRPAGPRPDPSQGTRGSQPASGRDAALAEAQKRFGTKSTVT